MLSESGGSNLSYDHDRPYLSTTALVLASICLAWYTFIILVSTIGWTQIWRHYSSSPARSSIETAADCPHVTVIRPVKGLDVNLYDCLNATFRQSYPKERLHICFCIESKTDSALPIVQRVLQDHLNHDARLYIADEDHNDSIPRGPNPKIRNMSQAYRTAEADIIWILDCNIWVPPGACGRMVDKLEARSDGRPYKFVDHLPVVVDVDSSRIDTLNTPTLLQRGGSRLEEIFMSTAHAKFYTAIQTVGVAPCIVGKSNMFRKHHLDFLTHGEGLDHFAHNICEDHLIGDLLWKKAVQEEIQGQSYGRHALVHGDIAVQPIGSMSVADYIARRTRWLRVRKWTVLLATLVEPTTESLVCSTLGAVGLVNLLHVLLDHNRPLLVGLVFWLLSVSMWCFADYLLHHKLLSGATLNIEEDNVPSFAHMSDSHRRRSWRTWCLTWACRELLAFPIWLKAVFGGGSVVWRGQRLWVDYSGKVHLYDSLDSLQEPNTAKHD